MLKSDILAAEYRGRAEQASAAAEASLLPQVRLRHRSAASVWLDLALFQERRTAAHTEAVAARRRVEADATAVIPIFGDTRCTV